MKWFGHPKSPRK